MYYHPATIQIKKSVKWMATFHIVHTGKRVMAWCFCESQEIEEGYGEPNCKWVLLLWLWVGCSNQQSLLHPHRNEGDGLMLLIKIKIKKDLEVIKQAILKGKVTKRVSG